MDLFQTYPSLWIFLAALLGQQIGSFLNLLIWRLPQMMQNSVVPLRSASFTMSGAFTTVQRRNEGSAYDGYVASGATSHGSQHVTLCV